MSGTKSKSRQTFVDPFEVGREVVRTTTQELTKQAPQAFLSQLFGIDFDKYQNDKAPVAEAVSAKPNSGEIFDIAKHQPQPSEKHKVRTEHTPKPHIEAALDYHGEFQNKVVKSREHASSAEKQEMKRNIEQIKIELERLVASSHMLKIEFGTITVEQTATVSYYHLNFLEWMLTVIRSARQKIEDSQSWVGAMKGKSAKKSYWGMFKKHGTTFGLSGERAVATQVG